MCHSCVLHTLYALHPWLHLLDKVAPLKNSFVRYIVTSLAIQTNHISKPIWRRSQFHSTSHDHYSESVLATARIARITKTKIVMLQKLNKWFVSIWHWRDYWAIWGICTLVHLFGKKGGELLLKGSVNGDIRWDAEGLGEVRSLRIYVDIEKSSSIRAPTL